MAKPKTITRYAVTYRNRDGRRTLAFENQGRHHYDTPEAAQEWIEAARKNSANTLRQIYGVPDTLEVRPVECYENGDAIAVYFDYLDLRKDY